MTVASTLAIERLLSACDSPLLAEFCRDRVLPPPGERSSANLEVSVALAGSWATLIERRPEPEREAVLQELEAITDLTAPLGNSHLLDAAWPDCPPAGVARGTPLALWFLLRRPDFFDAVWRNHLHRDLDVSRAARVEPCPKPKTPTDAPDRLLGELRALGLAQGWSVIRHDLSQAGALALVAERSATGKGVAESLPAGLDRPLQSDRLEFSWYPAQGTLLLHPGLGPEQHLLDLLAAFARSVGAGSLLAGPAFDTDRLRWPFPPPPDDLDLEEVRLKCLHLRYPERDGSRLVLLDTLETDTSAAVEELLDRHVPQETLLELGVHQADIQLRLRVGDGSRHHLIRLYPNFCDLGRGALGERLLACVRRWGL